MPDAGTGRLRQGCRLTGAVWAAIIGSEDGSPVVLSAYRVPPNRAARLRDCLSSSQGRAWLAKLASKSGVREKLDGKRWGLGARWLWGFALGNSNLLAICADRQGPSGLGTWSLISSFLQSAPKGAVAGATLQPELAYDSQQALDGILGSFLEGRAHDGAWLAIRHGEQLSVTASRNLTDTASPLDVRANPLLRRIRETRKAVIATPRTKDWKDVPEASGPAARYWAGFPLAVRDRFIGAVAIWGRAAPSAAQVEQLADKARQLSQQVDIVVSMQEVTSQLRRLATLNEFALAISSTEQLPQMAERVLAHLNAIFPAHATTLYVPSMDGQFVQEFRAEGSQFAERTTPMLAHPIAEWFTEGGSSREQGLGQDEAYEERQFTLPLRYREATVGVLALEGGGQPELSRYDQSMLSIVASYMAGVVERGRLRIEAVERAKRLEETVKQLQEAELTASSRLAAQQAAESRLVQAAKLVAVGEMAAGVAHELNNPLTTVTGFAELILDETPANATYRADLEMVLREAHRARSVVRRLLDFARQGDHLMARADVNEIVEDVLALMTHFIHTSGVQLELSLTQGLPWINLDANQMKQVLLNLLHNALHAMPGGGRLQVRTSMQRRDERDWVLIEVTDNGTGMEPAQLERIFEPFYTTRAESGGTGLGLAVTYGIVSDHGGTIEVESQRGGGSTFTVWLPA
jgi:signal transduction histidine kinase